MTEKSYFFTTGGGGDGASTYTQDDLSNAMKVVAACLDEEGVAAGLLNALAPSANGANSVRVASGGAMVDGKPYMNTANVDTNIPSAVGGGNTRIDRIVLRASWGATRTVRITRIAGTDAASPTAPAITQTPGTTYDIKICQVLVNTSGTVTVTDERVFAQLSSANGLGADVVTTAKILDDAVTAAKIADAAIDDAAKIVDGTITAAKIANRARKFVVPAGSGYNETDSTVIAAYQRPGLIFPDNKKCTAQAMFEVPQDYASGMTVKALVAPVTDSGDANMYAKLEGYKATGSTFASAATWANAFAAVATAGDMGDFNEMLSLSLTGVAVGDEVSVIFSRDATNVLDTMSASQGFLGFLVEYTADS